MSSGSFTQRRHTATQLAPLLESARCYWAFATDAHPPQAAWRCATCGRDTHAPSVSDPSLCLGCAPRSTRPNPYAWRPAPFGRIRKVSPFVAALWESEVSDG